MDSSFASPNEEDANVKKHIAQKEYMRLKALNKEKRTSKEDKAAGTDSAKSGLPPGQTKAPSWLVLDIRPSGFSVPSEDEWTIDLRHHHYGNTLLRLKDLKLRKDVMDISAEFHCVTSWSCPSLVFRGVPFLSLLRDSFISHATASSNSIQGVFEIDFHTILQFGADGYTTSMAVHPWAKDAFAAATDPAASDLLSNAYVIWEYKRLGKDDCFQPLGEEHGVVRLFFKDIYGYKSCKWLRRIDLLSDPLHAVKGFWEAKGYHSIGGVHSEERFEVDSSIGKVTRAIMNPLNGWFSWYAITFPDLFLVAQQVLSGDVFRSLFRPKFYLMFATFWGCMPYYFGKESLRFVLQKMRILK